MNRVYTKVGCWPRHRRLAMIDGVSEESVALPARQIPKRIRFYEAQFMVVLEGDFSISTTDGETKHFRPGDVFRVEDTPPCKGHIAVVGDKPGFFLFAR